MAKETHIPPFMEEGLNPFKHFKFPGADIENLMTMYQKNIELMSSAQEIATETTKSVMELQRQYMKRAFDQWNDQVKSYCSKTPLQEKASSHADAAKEAVNQTLEHIQEVNSIIAKSNEQINKSIQKRFKEGLDESLNMAKKTKDT